MYILYARPGSGSVVCEALLELSGAAYAIETVERDASGAFPESFQALNPMAQVPVLVLPGGPVMTESAAIAFHLADLYPQMGMAPGLSDPKRADYLRWMLFLATTIYTDDLRMYYPARYTDDPHGAAAVKSAAIRQMDTDFEIYANALGAGPFILGETMSAVDIYAAMLVTWMPDVKACVAKYPVVKAMYNRVAAVPAIGKVFARNRMDPTPFSSH